MMNCRCACAWNAFHAPSDGAGTVSSIRLMASSVVRPAKVASAVSLMRCDSTATARSLTSSGTTYPRPSEAAQMRAQRVSANAPRMDEPMAMFSS